MSHEDLYKARDLDRVRGMDDERLQRIARTDGHDLQAAANFEIGFRRSMAPEQFPEVVTYNGQRYFLTSKRGTSIPTGLPSAEYRRIDENGDARVWRDTAGNLSE